jgi:hypothetical protein
MQSKNIDYSHDKMVEISNIVHNASRMISYSGEKIRKLSKPMFLVFNKQESLAPIFVGRQTIVARNISYIQMRRVPATRLCQTA